MLKKFSVSNFKNFENEIIFDLSKVKNYEFNLECIASDTVRMAQIYGPNASGKSNLGLAIFDLVAHLTDNKGLRDEYEHFLNAFSDEDLARFSFDFEFRSQKVNYSYGKRDHQALVYETLTINDEIVVQNDKRDLVSVPFVSLIGAETLSLDSLKSHDISILKYIARNTVLDSENCTNLAFLDMMHFVENMLFFRSAVPDNRFQGFPPKIRDIDAYILKSGKLEDFQEFLRSAGINCELDYEESENEAIVFNFGRTSINFKEIASMGTKSLRVLYFWLLSLEERKKAGLVFIDEFDAYYHHKLSEFVVSKLKQMRWLQILVTTHNTTLMGNEILRPDCNFILSNNKVNPIFSITTKELREAHNIEKMYRAGAFENVE